MTPNPFLSQFRWEEADFFYYTFSFSLNSREIYTNSILKLFQWSPMTLKFVTMGIIQRKRLHTALPLHLLVALEFKRSLFQHRDVCWMLVMKLRIYAVAKAASDKWSLGQRWWPRSFTAWDKSSGTCQPPAWDELCLCLQQATQPGNWQHFSVPQTSLFTMSDVFCQLPQQRSTLCACHIRRTS